MRAPLPSLCLLALGLCACSVTVAEDEAPPLAVNSCQEDSDCEPLGRCVEGRCQALQGTLTSVLVEVSPPLDAPDIGGSSFVRALELPEAGGVTSIDLGHIAVVTGSVTAELSETQKALGCSLSFVDAAGARLAGADDGSIPVRVTFTPTQRFLGLSSGSFITEASLTGLGYRFSGELAAGVYHVSIQPAETEDPRCALPPRLIRAQTIQSGQVAMPVQLPTPQHLSLAVRWPIQNCETSPNCDPLKAWRVDVIDGDTGRPLSALGVLDTSNPEVADGKHQATVELMWTPALHDDDSVGQELIRLSPPEGVVGPQVLMERSVVELFGSGERVMDPFEQLPLPVEVQGQVSARLSSEAVPSTVTLVATELLGMKDGVFGSYVQVLETAEDGHFSVSLLPGQYRVYAQPRAGAELSASETQWAIATTPALQAGKVIELSEPLQVAGTVFGPTGTELLPAVPVELRPAADSTVTKLLDRVLGAEPFTPRAVADATDSVGRFQLRVDEGRFDLSVRSPAATGFSWFVRPNVNVDVPMKDLGEIAMPMPVRYTGEVTAPATGKIPGALVRVFIRQDESGYTADASAATSVLQVGETEADENGDFELLLPARL